MTMAKKGTALLITLLTTLAGGCAQNAVRQDAVAAQTAPQEPETEQQEEANLPKVPLTPDLLYALLVGEFAGQRGVLGLSTQHYLAAAEHTSDPRIARRATHIALYSRDYRSALAAAQVWVDTAPQSLQARQSLCTLLLRFDRNDEVLAQLRSLIDLTGNSRDGFHVVTKILANDSKPERALGLIQALASDYPNNPDAALGYAELLYEFERYDQSLERLKPLLKQHGDNLRGWVLRAKVEHALDDDQAALQSMKQALRLDEQNAQLRLTYARMLIDEDRLEEAREQFHLLEQSHDESADMIYAGGLLAQQVGDYEAAESQFKRLLETERRNEAAYALGQLAEIRDDDEEALQWYKAVSGGDNSFDAGLRIAILTARNNGLEKALAHLRSLRISEDEQIVRKHIVEAELYREKDQYSDAMEVYDKGLELFPNQVDLLYARAMNAVQLDRIDQLEQDLKRVLENDPDHVQALNALGYTLADTTERYQEALGYIQRAYKLQPDDPAILDSMGWVLYKLGRYEESLNYLRQAAQMLDDGEILAHLGEVLWHNGRREEAQQVLQRAQEQFPQHEILNQTVNRLIP